MTSIVDTQKAVVADLQSKLADAMVTLHRLEKTHKFPIKTKMYIHSCEDTNYDDGKKLGLTETQLEVFYRAGYEVTIDIEIQEDGTAYATHLNSIPLTMQVQI